MGLSSRADAKERIHATIVDCGLIANGTNEFWQQKIKMELADLFALPVSADALNNFHRLLINCVSQAANADPTLPYFKMCQSIAEKVQKP